jgi:ubiquilin
VAPSATIQELKATIAEKSEIPAERQRLIYSGRVLKDAETVSSYNIKSGYTIHLVKGAAPSTGAAQAGATSTATNNSTSTNASSQVPSNIAAGQGSGNILADLTGARYAGMAQLPSASMFGPDGGMGSMNPDAMLSMMEQPQVQEALREMLSNPQMVDQLIQSNPQLRNMGPQFRQMMQTDYFRNMLTNPQMLRQMMQMQQAMGALGGGPQAGGGNFPAPGEGEQNTANRETTGDSTNSGTNAGAAAAGGNPFAALFGNPPAGGGTGGESDGASGGQQNPFAALLGGQGAGGAGFDPALLQSMLGGGAPQEPEDNRPPEERYESQLRQLNELGFTDFDRNVRALRRAGGSVQGAVEALLDGQV